MRFLSIEKNDDKNDLKFEARFDAGLAILEETDSQEGVIIVRYHTDNFPKDYLYLGEIIDLLIVLGNEDIYCVGVSYCDEEPLEFMVELNDVEKTKLLIHIIKDLIK